VAHELASMDVLQHYLSQQLFRFNGSETFTGRDAFEGAFVSGALGAGKSSGPGSLLSSSMLRAGYGFAVCVAKPDELELWCRYFKGTGRDPRDDIRVIQPSPMHPGQVWPRELGEPFGYRHNVLQHEFRSGGYLVDNVVDVLHSAVVGGVAAAKENDFWERSSKEMLRNAVSLSVMQAPAPQQASIRLDDVLDIIMTAPTSMADLESRTYKAGRCAEALRLADERLRDLPDPQYRDLQLAARYWLVQHLRMAEETRTSIQATITSKISSLLWSPFRELLNSESDPEAAPERSLQADPRTGHAKVLVFNIPVKLFGEAGRTAQLLLKAGWQKAVDRRIRDIRNNDPRCRPVSGWADEAQYFVTRQDATFQQTARDAMAATVFLTQNLPNLYAELGEHHTHSLLGNLQTKIILANGDTTTNEWAERLFGKAPEGHYSTPATGNAPATFATQVQPLVPAIKFTELKKGGVRANPTSPPRVGGLCSRRDASGLLPGTFATTPSSPKASACREGARGDDTGRTHPGDTGAVLGPNDYLEAW
jgi:hypothetical protein